MLKLPGLTALIPTFVVCTCITPGAQESTSKLEFRLANDNETPGWTKFELPRSDKPIFVSSEVSLDGRQIEKVSFFKDRDGHPAIGLSLTDEGGKAMLKLTSQNHEKKLAILLNGKVISAHTIRDRISKEVQITGKFNNDDLLSFFQAIVLRELP